MSITTLKVLISGLLALACLSASIYEFNMAFHADGIGRATLGGILLVVGILTWGDGLGTK